MKTKMTLTLIAALGAFTLAANAQDAGGMPPDGGQGGPGMGGHRPPPTPAIIRALDANHDGVIDADEIANASAALKTLDKNGDGKLTPDEFMGPRPAGKPPGENDARPGSEAGAPPDGTPPPQQ